MEKRQKILRRVIFLCFDFTRQLSYHRELGKFKDQKNDRFNLNFWTTMYNNTIDLAVLEWCYFFKSHKDDLHWKKIVDDIDTFKGGLLDYLKLNNREWEKYRETVAKYRDKGIAHHEFMDSIEIPDMTIALNAVSYYYNYVMKKLPTSRMNDKLPLDLLDYFEKSLKQSEKILSLAFKPTKHLKEKNYFIF